jgi:predicted amidophosphoribosyltransferase
MLLDLVLPLECGGCGAPGRRWCLACAASLVVHADEPVVIAPRLDPGVPVFSLGRYAGPRRAAIIAMKEHGRTDLIPPLAVAVHDGLTRLIGWGIVDAPLALVPAPTRRSAARRRGGDPVTAIARTAAVEDVAVVSALRMRAFTADSVGLSPAQRQRNIAGRVRLRRTVSGEVLLIDDVVTTGATAGESVRVLQTAGVRVVAILAMAHA